MFSIKTLLCQAYLPADRALSLSYFRPEREAMISSLETFISFRIPRNVPFGISRLPCIGIVVHLPSLCIRKTWLPLLRICRKPIFSRALIRFFARTTGSLGIYFSGIRKRNSLKRFKTHVIWNKFILLH